MKFVSKSTNLLIVLKPGMQASPLTGTPAIPSVSVRFKEGQAEVTNPEMIAMMLAHPGFNSDFISTEGLPSDPYANSRQESEPAHILTEMKFGTPTGRSVGNAPIKLSPEMQKLIEQMATNLAEKMLPGMVEKTLTTLVANNEKTKVEKVEKVVEEAISEPEIAPESTETETSVEVSAPKVAKPTKPKTK